MFGTKKPMAVWVLETKFSSHLFQLSTSALIRAVLTSKNTRLEQNAILGVLFNFVSSLSFKWKGPYVLIGQNWITY